MNLCCKLIHALCPRLKQSEHPHQCLQQHQTYEFIGIEQSIQKQPPRQPIQQLQEEQNESFTFEQIPQEDEQVLGDSSYGHPLDYMQDIPKDHHYYHILSPKLDLLPTIFDVGGVQPHQPEAEYPLKIYCYQPVENRPVRFVYHFSLPCSYEVYDNMMNDFNLQKSFDSNIDQYECLMESPENDTKIIYLAYKRVLVVSSRDFAYVRYNFNRNGEYWSICTTMPDYEQFTDKVRGEIILTATRVIKTPHAIQISVYSEIDMKMNLKINMVKTRGYTEIKKYLDKCYAYVKSQTI